MDNPLSRLKLTVKCHASLSLLYKLQLDESTPHPSKTFINLKSLLLLLGLSCVCIPFSLISQKHHSQFQSQFCPHGLPRMTITILHVKKIKCKNDNTLCKKKIKCSCILKVISLQIAQNDFFFSFIYKKTTKASSHLQK